MIRPPVQSFPEIGEWAPPQAMPQSALGLPTRGERLVQPFGKVSSIGRFPLHFLPLFS
jgi:hypothetical protein